MVKDKLSGMVIGIAYFQKDEWDRLLSTAQDREALEDTYEEWEASVARLVRNARKVGTQLIKVPVSVEDILEYCRQENVPQDAAARNGLVARLVQEGRGEAFEAV